MKKKMFSLRIYESGLFLKILILIYRSKVERIDRYEIGTWICYFVINELANYGTWNLWRLCLCNDSKDNDSAVEFKT